LEVAALQGTKFVAEKIELGDWSKMVPQNATTSLGIMIDQFRPIHISLGISMSRSVWQSVADGFRSIGRKTDPLEPPRKLIDEVGGGNFAKVGCEFFGYFRQFADLRPTDRILDVGCGCGRMAVPLIPYLVGGGEYYGFDISRKAILWCQKHIQRKHSNFHFDLADIFNGMYNKSGTKKPLEYRFPYEDAFFDFTFLTSVFTHLLPPEMEHYVAEISRTLKPGGKCMATYFLLNAESRALLQAGKSGVPFEHSLPGCLVSQKNTPEAAVAFEEDQIRAVFARAGLDILRSPFFGSWPGREQYFSFQDMVLAIKK
jgi:SAM-dependent methyltransferase